MYPKNPDQELIKMIIKKILILQVFFILSFACQKINNQDNNKQRRNEIKYHIDEKEIPWGTIKLDTINWIGISKSYFVDGTLAHIIIYFDSINCIRLKYYTTKNNIHRSFGYDSVNIELCQYFLYYPFSDSTIGIIPFNCKCIGGGPYRLSRTIPKLKKKGVMYEDWSGCP